VLGFTLPEFCTAAERTAEGNIAFSEAAAQASSPASGLSTTFHVRW
jgi:hypothetical protein